MSAGRIVSLVTVMISCAVLAFTASAARAQATGDVPPVSRLAPAPIEAVTPTSSPMLSDLGTLGLGLPLQLSASLVAYRWFAPVMAPVEAGRERVVNFALHGAGRSAWWRKRI